MKAVILAAGEGVRMRPLTLNCHKSMLPVLGQPLLHHIWESLPEKIAEIVLVVGYKRETIQDHFGDEYLGKKISYVVQEEKTGTGRALQLCQSNLAGESKFLVLYADDLHHGPSIKKCLTHDRSILVSRVADPRRFGVVATDRHGRVIEIEEKPEQPRSNLVACGVYLLDQHIFDYEPAQAQSGEYYLTDMIKQLIREQEVFAVETEFWHPVGYPQDLAMAELALRSK